GNVPDLPVVLKLAGGHLEPQVEELLARRLELLLEVRQGHGVQVFGFHFLPLVGLAGGAAGAPLAGGAAPGAALAAGAALPEGPAPGAPFGPRAGGAATAATAPATGPAAPASPVPSAVASPAPPWTFPSPAA